MAPYTDVQFIGYALTTTPAITAELGFPLFVEGRYIGIDPPLADIDARIAMIMNALAQTVAAPDAVDASPTTLKIFMMPEFPIRGPQGAYDNDPPAIDYFKYFRKELARRVADASWKDWLFVAGTFVETVGYVRKNDPELDHKAQLREKVTMALANAWANASVSCPTVAGQLETALDAFADYCRHEPLYQVTDKCYVVAGGPPDPADYPDGLSIQKKFMSNEDFVLNLYGKSVTENQCAYPLIPEFHGEDKLQPFDDYSIFTTRGIKFGLEVCLDHYNARLRTNRLPESELVQIQLVPSCGMQIQPASVIAGPDGLVFNCDGQYGGMTTAEGTLWCSSTISGAHAQVAQVVTPCGDCPPAQNAVNAQLVAPSASKVTTISIDAPDASKLYAYGAGQVLVFEPLPVPPPVAAPVAAGVLVGESEAHG